MVLRALFLVFLLVGCQSTPGGHVQVSSTYPPGKCEEIGQVIGTSNSTKDSKEKAMADLRSETAARQGNFVRVLAISAHGAAVRGIAYRCR
ncbi:MAG: hypothetical protein AAF203_07095 [Pseudomonadota bacterium]